MRSRTPSRPGWSVCSFGKEDVMAGEHRCEPCLFGKHAACREAGTCACWCAAEPVRPAVRPEPPSPRATDPLVVALRRLKGTAS